MKNKFLDRPTNYEGSVEDLRDDSIYDPLFGNAIDVKSTM